jgi:hypothetical protein
VHGVDSLEVAIEVCRKWFAEAGFKDEYVEMRKPGPMAKGGAGGTA